MEPLNGYELVIRAVQFAAQAHAGQVRKYTGEPYLMHVLAVARGVASRTNDPEIIAAAVLHDVLEDTPTTYVQLRWEFGARTAMLVWELTDFYTKESFPTMNRQERKRLEAERFSHVSAEAQLVKTYDLLDNTSTITQHDPGFAKVYLDEKRMLVSQMTKLEDHELNQLKARL